MIEHAASQLIMRDSPFQHLRVPAGITRITISVADLAKSRVLYETVLSIPLKYEMPGMAMLVTSDGVELRLRERLGMRALR